MSEDGLYLNVWTPAKSMNDHIPVLVWIYGGGYKRASIRFQIRQIIDPCTVVLRTEQLPSTAEDSKLSAA